MELGSGKLRKVALKLPTPKKPLYLARFFSRYIAQQSFPSQADPQTQASLRSPGGAKLRKFWALVFEELYLRNPFFSLP